MSCNNQTTSQDELRPLKKDWRFRTGMTALALALVAPLLALGVPFLGLPAVVSTVLVGALIVGVPEVLLLVAGVLLGKEVLVGFLSRLKRLVFRK